MNDYSDHNKFCPRCRRPGAPVRDGVNSIYPCGTVFNADMGTFSKLACEFKRITPHEALKEAEAVLQTFGHPKIVHEHRELNKPLLGGPDFTKEAKYLLWDADVLMSVLNNAENFLGTTLEFTEPMNQVWVVDPAFISGDEHMVVGTMFSATRHALEMVQLLQPLKGWPDVAPFVRWQEAYHWGRTIDTLAQAQAAAVYTWLQQPYVVQVDAIQRSRQQRRYAERKNLKLNNISVIEFRRPEGARTTTPKEGKTRELHCCFERAGYTRRQPYGPKNSLRRVQWIAPTFVGDPEKPFKPKGQKLYKVSR